MRKRKKKNYPKRPFCFPQYLTLKPRFSVIPIQCENQILLISETCFTAHIKTGIRATHRVIECQT